MATSVLFPSCVPILRLQRLDLQQSQQSGNQGFDDQTGSRGNNQSASNNQAGGPGGYGMSISTTPPPSLMTALPAGGHDNSQGGGGQGGGQGEFTFSSAPVEADHIVPRRQQL